MIERAGGYVLEKAGKILGKAEVDDLARTADKVRKAEKKSHHAGENSGTVSGRARHAEFAEQVEKKDGWKSEPKIEGGPNNETGRPDALDPKGRPVELKPDTPTGHKSGKRQMAKYKRITGKNGRVIYYDP